jgi:mannose-6-phosphate isomerase
VKLAPARLAPLFMPRIWGSRNLAPLFAALPGKEPIGEVWLTGDACAFAPDSHNGSLAGQSLGQVWPTLPAEWTGTRLRDLPRIPVLAKFIFPEDKLSLQVHPGDEYAREHESAAGGVGKTEMWYAVAAREGAQLRMGLEPGVTAESLRHAIEEGTAERCVTRFPVHAGDAFFVPAGTVHTIGAGMVLCEIQQHSDITYRMYDYGRIQADGTPRPLHLRQALEVTNFGVQNGRRVVPLETRRGSLEETFLAACRYFAAEHWEFSERVAAETSPGQFELLIVLAGRGRIAWAAESAAYEPAQAWFLPAALGAYQLLPEPDAATKLIHAYVPNLEEFAQRLAARQAEPSAVAQVMHP